MFVTDAISALAEYQPEPTRNDKSRLIQESVITFCIGEHGPEYRLEKPSPADHESVLNCGCSLFFPVQPMPGELLLCTLHDDWFKSQPATVKLAPAGEHLVKCNSCPAEYGPMASGRAYTYARRHSYGKNGNKNPPHHVSIGKPSDGGITWTEYSRKDN